MGKAVLRFPGANKPKGILKAASEPFARADFRIYLRQPAAVGCATGAKLLDIYPFIRADYSRTAAALCLCAMLMRATPYRQPSEDKYLLLSGFLDALERGDASPWLALSYSLRLMQLAGYGMEKPISGVSRQLWDSLHDFSFMDFSSLDGYETQRARVRFVVDRFAEKHLDNMLVSDYLDAPDSLSNLVKSKV